MYSKQYEKIRRYGLPVIAMVAVVLVSNILVQYPLNDWLTWGAFSYPFAFLVTDLSNRQLGSLPARKVIYFGFLAAVILSVWFAGPRIAIASGVAFLVGQLLDVYIFNWQRNTAWWRAPLVSSLLASLVDSFLFFYIAFSYSGLPWITWALGDYMIKIAVAIILLIPYAAVLRLVRLKPN